jgi:hypothetical protein
MSNRIMIAGGLLLAFVIGTMAAGFYTNSSNAFNPPISNSFSAPQELSRPVPQTIVRTTRTVPRTQYVAPRAVATTATSSEPVRSVETPKKRTLKKSAMIVGGSAGAGAAIGAVSGGKKGAAIGAVSGGVAGLIYDMATRNKN